MKQKAFYKRFRFKIKLRRQGQDNTIYSISLENMNLCFLGALGDITFQMDVKEELGDVGYTFLAIGGEGVIDPAQGRKAGGGN
jgi:hypothetical protein